MKCVALVSGGIDSPVAAHLVAHKGMDTIPLFFDNYPFSGDATRERAMAVINRLRQINKRIKEPVVFKHGENLSQFAQKCKRRYACVLCKRMMFRAASKYGEGIGAEFLVTGDSLAQVASQTLQNIFVTEQASSLPIIRPLIGLDKIEIEELAKRIGTFELSTQPALCCIAVPPKPATAVSVEDILREENKVDIKNLLEKTLSSKS